eukprot:COSAG05_NODE_4691_length_1408_cov_0.974026_3_plen_154_part_01
MRLQPSDVGLSHFDSNCVPQDDGDTPRADVDGAEHHLFVKHRQGRSASSFTLFLLIEGVLLPVYILLAAFMWWIAFLVPNILSAVGVVISTTIPTVLLLGVRGAMSKSQKELHGFAFLLLLAVNMQLSVVIVVVLNLDDGEMSADYLQSIARGL